MSSQFSYRVLAVDDVPLMCQFINETIRTLDGFECITASDIISAETILNSANIDMAILDIKLKGDSGLVIAKNIRRGVYQCSNKIPIFIFTGNAYQQEINDCLKYDINSVIVKPCSFKLIHQRLISHKAQLLKINDADYYEKIAEQEKQKALKEQANMQKNEKMADTKWGMPSHSAKPFHSDRKTSAIRSKAIVQKIKTKKIKSAKNTTSSNAQQEELSQVINWPMDKSLGYFQLDKRFKSVEYSVNSLVTLRKNMKFQPASEEVVRLRRTFDNIEYIATNLRKNYPKDELWEVFFRLLDDIRSIPFENLANRGMKSLKVSEILSQLEKVWQKLVNETQQANPKHKLV